MRSGRGSSSTEEPAQSAAAASEFLRVNDLLAEANEISKALRKHTVFSRAAGDAPGPADEDGGCPVLVHNTRLNIQTTWPQERFEARLELMREAYAAYMQLVGEGAADGGSGSEEDEDAEAILAEADALFYDPDDNWLEVRACRVLLFASFFFVHPRAPLLCFGRFLFRTSRARPVANHSACKGLLFIYLSLFTFFVGWTESRGKFPQCSPPVLRW